VGSDSNGVWQADGMIDDLYTYNVPLDAGTILDTFNSFSIEYLLNPNNRPEIKSAPSSSTTYTPLADVITGQGNLVTVSNVANCYDGITTNTVWITNVVAQATGNGTMTIQFTIEGGYPGLPYDVFANSVLSFGPNGVPWAWEGQGYQCTRYSLAITNTSDVFIILGTPQDTDQDGLTDAYEELVSKSSPTNYSTDGTGMADGWEVLYFGQIGVSPNGDPDGDGLTTYQEWLMNSQGYNPVQWHSFTNNVVGDGYQNYSGDGLPNLMQASFGGNMLTNNLTWKVNVSGDGLSDEYKTLAGLNTNTASTVTGLPTSYSQNPVP